MSSRNLRASLINPGSGKSPLPPRLPGPQSHIGWFVQQLPAGSRIVVAYSGGLDSHVLLHAMHNATRNASGARHDLTLEALHIDHALQESSRQWADHCRQVCENLQLPVTVRQAAVSASELSSSGPEAAARLARYEEFAAVLRPGDFLLLAQHADDQAETFLLQALRGSGPDGLACMPRQRPFADGLLCRPLLGCTRSELHDYADHHQLQWIEDPSNADTRYDRNFLRQEILPLLESRWPSAARTLGRSASRSAAASQLLLKLAATDLASVQPLDSQQLLNIDALTELGEERLFNVLRLWVRQAGFRLPRLQDLRQVNSDLLNNARQTGGLVKTRDYEFRRYRNHLYLLQPQDQASTSFCYAWIRPFADLHIPEAGITLSNDECLRQGLTLPSDAAISVRNRQGGELIRLGRPVMHKSVKKLLQEADIPPWRRQAVPLLYVNDQLAAVWQVAVSTDFQL